MRHVMRKVAVLVLVSAGALAGACKGSSGNGGDGDGGATSGPSGGGALTVCDQAAAAYCQQLFACDAELGKFAYGSVEGCRAEDATICRWMADLGGVTASSVDAWVACDRAIAAQSCDQMRFGGAVEACRLPAGTRKVGETCISDAQCATTYCREGEAPSPPLPSTDLRRWCGVCAPPNGVGQACRRWSECDFGLSCIGEVCVRELSEGALCDERSGAPCQGELICVSGRCARPVDTGGSCASGASCAWNLRCVNGTCGPGLGGGEPCREDDDVCAQNFVCVAGACTRLKGGGEVCASSLECDSATCVGMPDPSGNGNVLGGHCQGEPTPAAIGEPCTREEEGGGDGGVTHPCGLNTFCDATTRRCVLRKRAGDACGGSDECIEVLECRTGKCAPAAEPMCPAGGS
jgi:hypothetical protein